MTPGETLGTLYNIRVGSNKTKQHNHVLAAAGPGGPTLPVEWGRGRLRSRGPGGTIAGRRGRICQEARQREGIRSKSPGDG